MHIYNCINTRASWKAPVIVTLQAISKLRLWKESTRQLINGGKDFKHNQLFLCNIFADASTTSYGLWRFYRKL